MQKEKAIRGTDSTNAYTITNHIDTVIKLKPEKWKNLSIQEKLNVLQTVANIKADDPDIPTEMNIGDSNLTDMTLDCFVDASYTIQFNLNLLEVGEAAEALTACCHEAYHAY